MMKFDGGADIQGFDLTLTAGETRELPYPGDFMYCSESTADADFYLQPNGLSKSVWGVGVGLMYPTAFEKVTITNGSTGQTLRLYIGFGSAIVARTATTIAGTAITAPVGMDTLGDAADVTIAATATTIIAAAATTARTVTIRADEGNTEELRIGTNGNVSATRGLKLLPGEAITLDTTSEISGICASGGQLVSICYVERS